MNRRINIVTVLAVLGSLLSACGGGGGGTESSPPSLPSKTLHWEAPTSYTDGTPMDPLVDLQGFEIYVREDDFFGPNDQAVAEVAPTDRTFNLALLAPRISKGTTYYVSLRAVSAIGLKSDYSPPASFSF